MRAALLDAWDSPLRLAEVPRPEPGPGQVLVKVAACGVCGTDLKIISGRHLSSPRVRLPHTLGHEVAGTVAALGSGVDSLKPGQRVALSMYAACGECEYCRAGRDTLCTNLKAWAGFDSPGGMAEYMVARAANLVPVPDGVPDAAAAICGDAVATGLHAVRTRGRVSAGMDMLSMGTGGVGLHAMQVGVALGARVLACDKGAAQRELARVHGAAGVIDGDGDVVAAVHALTGGRGVDVALDATGDPAAQHTAALCLKPGGRLVLVGYRNEGDFALANQLLVLSELEVVGSRACTTRELAEALEWVAKGRLHPVVEAVLPLAACNDAIDRLRRGATRGRLVLDPSR